MPAKLPSRAASTRVKSPATPSRGRSDAPVHSSSSSARPRPSLSPPNYSLKPPPGFRSRSHEHGRNPESASSSSRRDPERDSYAAPRRRSTHRSSISPRSRHDSPGSNRRDSDRRPRSSDRSSHRRRESYSPSPDKGSSARDRESRGRVRFDDSGRRERPVSPLPGPSRQANVSPPYQSGGGTQQPGAAPVTAVPGYASASQPRVSPYATAPGHAAPTTSTQRPVTPPKYKPQTQAAAATAGANTASATRPVGATTTSKPEPATEAPGKAVPASVPASSPSQHTGSMEKLAGKFGNLPTAMLAYTGVKELSKHAGTAKEWADWVKDLGETPEEIAELSAKATTARDTITQIQEMLKARPDLLEGEQGEKLKEQLDEVIKKTDKTLSKMTNMLADLSKNSAKEGTLWRGLQDFWNSYQYKNEWEDKVKAADEDLQKDLVSLSTLMVNVHTRAVMKPAPPAPTSSTTASQAPTGTQPAGDGDKESRSKEILTPPPTVAAASIASTAPPAPAPKTVPEVVETLVPDKMAKQNVEQTDKAAVKDAAMASQAYKGDASPEPPPEPDLGTADGDRPPSPDTVAEAEEVIGFDLSDRAKAPLPKYTTPAPPPAATSTSSAPYPVDSPPTAAPPAASSTKSTPYPVEPTTAAVPVAPAAAAAAAVPLQASSNARRESVASILSDEEAQDALLDAAWEGDLDAVARALRRAPISSCDKRGLTPLHLAVERDNLAVAIMLLDRGADVHARANGGRVPLHLASRFASPETVEMLLERAHANPNSKTSDGRTPLHYAASAAEDGDEARREVIRLLRDWDADPTAEDRKGETPRDVAQKRDFWDAAATLRRAERRWDDEHHQSWLQRHGFAK